MARDKCDACGTALNAVDVVQAEVGVFDNEIPGAPPQRKIDLVVACPDCGFRYFTFIATDTLVAENE